MSEDPKEPTGESAPPADESHVVQTLASIPVERFVRAACYSGIASMLTMAWSVVDPRPLPVMMASTVGPAVAVLAFLLYLGAVMVPRKK